MDGENEGVRNRAIVAAVAAGILAIGALTTSPAGAAALPRTHPGAAGSLAKDPVDINHASLNELLTVPGMTHSWAGRIVRFRPYRAKNDLLERGVLPSGVYDRIKEYIVAHRRKQAD